MEKDIKHAIKKLEEKRKKIEKTEKIILFLSGIILIVIFAIIGLNIYTGIGEKVSEPEVEIVKGNKIPTKSEVVEPVEEQKTKEVKKEEKREEKVVKEKKVEETGVKEKRVPLEKAKKEEKKKKEILTMFYSIQLGAFSLKKNAENFIEKRKLKDAFIVYRAGLYRVMVGKFKTKKEAYLYMKKKGIKGIVKKVKSM